MNNQSQLYSLDMVVDLINKKRVMAIAGTKELLEQLPKGNWIGGTIPYFMCRNGGEKNLNMLFVTDYSDLISDFRIEEYSSEQIEKITTNNFTNGFTYLLIPGFSDIHVKYAIEAAQLPGIYDIPMFGWITGFDLDNPDPEKPMVFNGAHTEASSNKALALHCKLPDSKLASIDIINMFEQGTGDKIMFQSDGFEAKEAIINGKEQNFFEYITKNQVDAKLPLVADYSGALINISIQNADAKNKKVQFYAPVLKNTEYRFAAPVEDYIKTFEKYIPADSENIISSCNCILNYLYSELEGKQTGDLCGPFTFGEIAYVLVNQTLVYLSVVDK